MKKRYRLKRRESVEEGIRRIAREQIDEALRELDDRGREAMAEAYACPTPEAFHEWRKRVKYHGYHLRLLKPLWPSILKEQRSAVDRLGEYLGEDHDLAVLRDALADGREAGKAGSPLEAFLALLDRRRLEFQSLARPLGERVYAEKPKALVDRFGAYWQAWR